MATSAELRAAGEHLRQQARQCDELAQTDEHPGPYIVAAQRYGQSAAVCFAEAEKIPSPSPPSLREVAEATQRLEAHWPGAVVELNGDGYALRRADGLMVAWGPSPLACLRSALEKILSADQVATNDPSGSPTRE